MKPQVFLGSSVEGLSVAYSIQTNLTHDADITVWSQGVFELSNTTIESLFEILERVDFGIFVFTPDDLLKIRDNSTKTVRDNVLFEFGLFLGKLGRKRVFFIIPSDHELHLPTDLLGITPAKYESNREDSNLIAATGPASHQVRLMLNKLGPLQQVEETSTEPEQEKMVSKENEHWFGDYMAKKYDVAISKIDDEIGNQTDEETIIRLKAIKAVCKNRLDEKDFELFDEILNYYKNSLAYEVVGQLLMFENYVYRAIEVIKTGFEKFGRLPNLIEILASCHLADGDKDLAIKCLEDDLTPFNPKMSIKLADIYTDDKNFEAARRVLHQAFVNFPNNNILWSSYAVVASELSLHDIALFFYDKLSRNDPDNIAHNGYIGNTCLQLNLNDIALLKYQKANELANESKSWILANIGNLLKNKGFYSESMKYLKKAIELDNASEYAHDRLAGALKSKEEEQKELKSILAEANVKLKEFSANLTLKATQLEN